jgi:hypothetical protein
MPEPLGQARLSPDRRHSEQLTIDAAEQPAIRIAEAYRFLKYRIEHRREVARR